MILERNMVIEWTSNPRPDACERVLWIREDHAWTIKIYGSKARPVLRNRQELEFALTSGEARRLSRDPFAHFTKPEHNIKTIHRARRDQAWAIIAPIMESAEPDIYNYYSRHSKAILISKN